MNDINGLQSAAEIIRDEINKNANSASRIGNMFMDIISVVARSHDYYAQIVLTKAEVNGLHESPIEFSNLLELSDFEFALPRQFIVGVDIDGVPFETSAGSTGVAVGNTNNVLSASAINAADSGLYLGAIQNSWFESQSLQARQLDPIITSQHAITGGGENSRIVIICVYNKFSYATMLEQ